MNLDLWPDYDQIAQESLSPDKLFLDAAIAGRNCCLTGMAGTGKSTLLRRFIEQARDRRVDVTAPTGVAALNVAGQTIHRWCGMMLGPQNGQTNEEYYEELWADPRKSIRRGFARVRDCQTLVIDEISMLPGRQLDFVEFLFRRIRSNDAPWGGCQVIVIGDFLQLPPVRTNEQEPYDWAFSSPRWTDSNFRLFTLTTVHRQSERDFVDALADFRIGHVAGKSARLLQARVKSNPADQITRLYTHNVQVDKWNAFQLDNLPDSMVELKAITSGPPHQIEFLKKNLLTPATLNLKPGAMVMFTVNKNVPGSTAVDFVNGQTGVVEDIVPNSIVSVRSRDEVILVEPFTWRYDSKDPDSATFTQFPLRLAWAMTIHKAQGLTLDSAHIDIRAAREPGQAYVAISRVKTMAGLTLKEWPKWVHVSQEAVKFYRNQP